MQAHLRSINDASTCKTNQSNVSILVVIQPSSDSTSGWRYSSYNVFTQIFCFRHGKCSYHPQSLGCHLPYNGNALVAMPGIGATASSVSGQTVNFSRASNLTAVQYGFTFHQGKHHNSGELHFNTLYTRWIGHYWWAKCWCLYQNVWSAYGNGQQFQLQQVMGKCRFRQTLWRKHTCSNDTLMVTLSYRSDLNTAQRMELVGSWDEGLIVGSGSMYIWGGL